MRMEERNYAGRGTTGLAATGTALGGAALAGVLTQGNGLLGGLFGGREQFVSKFELEQQNKITEKDMEIAYLKGRDAAKTDSLELHKYVDGRFRGVEAQIASQAVVNAQITANLSCLQNSVAALQGLTKTVIPIANVCPEPMALYNSWTAPTATTTG